MADECSKAKDATDGLDHTLEGATVWASEEKKLGVQWGLTERVWMYPSACSTGIVRLRFEGSAQGRGEWIR